MSSISVNTDAPFEFVIPDDYDREARDRAEATERARYLQRKHGLPEIAAYATAFAQIGWGANRTARAIGSTEKTVAKHLDDIEESFGLQARVCKAPEHRTGPLDEGTLPYTTGPDAEPTVRDDTPGLDGNRTLPEAMLKRDQWVCRDGKVPIAPWAPKDEKPTATSGVDAQNERNWTGFETAEKWASMLPTHGLMFVLKPTGGLAAVDLDGCRDPDTGELEPWAQDIIERADAFAEVSPSGTGVHIYVKGSVPQELTNGAEGVELYDNRQMTVTGQRVAGTPDNAPERQGFIDDLAEEYMLEASRHAPSGQYEDDGDDWSPFDVLRVTDVYPDLATGTNIPHPEHGTTSEGGNFRISEDGETATCWRGEHQYGRNDGCGLNAHHLLAMRVTGSENCAAVRDRWAEDDGLVFETWAHAVQNEEFALDPSPPPWRALRYIADEHDILGLEDGGQQAQIAFRIVCRIIRHEHGIKVDFDDGVDVEVA
jgi:hypothetical protein